MQLSNAQLEQYRRDGYLVFPELFSAAELDVLRAELARVQEIESEAVFRERTGAVRTVFRVHDMASATASAPYNLLQGMPRFLGPARQVLGDDNLYIHHTKCNMKDAIEGAVWQWHQDYGSWRLDGIERPDLATFLVMLEDASEIGGCLYFLPGSHKQGRVEPVLDDKTTSYKLWVVPKERLLEVMANAPEPVPIVGKAGTAVLFDCNLMHASGHNLSRQPRWHIYYVYNRCANRPQDVPSPRPAWVRGQDWQPIIPCSDDAILNAEVQVTHS